MNPFLKLKRTLLYLGMLGALQYMARFFTNFFIFHNYWQKKRVSVREALLIKGMFEKLFTWSIFKVEIKDDDKFIYIDEKRGSAKMMRLDNRTAYGKAYYPWILLFSGAIMWGACMALSVTFGD